MSEVSEVPPQQPPGPPVRPLDVPVLRVVAWGSVAWGLTLVVTLLVPSLHEDARSWWPATCAAGLTLGGIGWAYLGRGPGAGGGSRAGGGSGGGGGPGAAPDRPDEPEPMEPLR